MKNYNDFAVYLEEEIADEEDVEEEQFIFEVKISSVLILQAGSHAGDGDWGGKISTVSSRDLYDSSKTVL